MSEIDKALRVAIDVRPHLDEPGQGFRSVFSDGFRSGWENHSQGESAAAHARQAVIDAARAHLAEIDSTPCAPERGGTIGRLREAIEDLDEEMGR